MMQQNMPGQQGMYGGYGDASYGQGQQGGYDQSAYNQQLMQGGGYGMQQGGHNYNPSAYVQNNQQSIYQQAYQGGNAGYGGFDGGSYGMQQGQMQQAGSKRSAASMYEGQY